MKIIASILSLCVFSQAWTPVIQNEFSLWKEPLIRIAHSDSSMPRINADEFCISLMRSAQKLGKAQCRIDGELERDSAFSKYLVWIGKNVDPRITPHNLVPRNSQVARQLRNISDDYLLVFSRNGDTTWITLFTGANSEAAALGFEIQKIADYPSIAERLGQTWFDGTPEKKLSAKEKEAAAIEPDASYGATPLLDSWIAIGGGWSQARIPLTPYSWYKNKLNQRIRYYRNTSDSLSGWNFLEDESPLLSLRAGFTWHGFIGGELFALRTTHKMKIDESDSIYQELDHWSYTRYEVGLTVHATLHHKLSQDFELQPHAFLGFHYSFLNEDIALKNGFEESAQYKSRIEFKPFYKGAIFGIGNRLVWKEHFAVETRAGLNNRGRSLDREPSEDAAPEPTIIAGSTLDCFISASLEYHWLKHR